MTQRFASIQYLRGICALLVVLDHARNIHPWLYNPLASLRPGAVSVDIFLIISGFILYSSSYNEGASEFLGRRLLRILPLYWIATFVTAPMIIMNHGVALNGSFVRHALQSLLLIPHYSPEHPDEIWPLLAVAWSLSYEMFFYFLFAAGLAVRRVLLVLPVAVATLVVGGLLVHSRNPIWISFTDPLLLNFLAGIGLAAVRHRIAGRNLAALLPLGIIGVVLSYFVHLPEVIGLGAPALAIVAGALSLEAHGDLPRLKLLSLLGSASYSIYLFQVLCIGVVGLVLQRLPVHGPLQFAMMVLLCPLMSACVGLALHRRLERPLSKALLNSWLRRRSGPPRRPGALSTLPQAS